MSINYSCFMCMKRQLYLALLLVLTYWGAHSQDTLIQPINHQWNHGFLLSNAEKSIILRFGGQVYLDHGYFSPNSKFKQTFGAINEKSKTAFDSARLYVKGNLYENTEFQIQLEFADGQVDFKDVYIGFINIPVLGTFRAGHFNEPFRFSTLNSSKFSSFIERPVNRHFSPKRNLGALVFNDFLNRRISAQLGVFHSATPINNHLFSNDGYAITGRATAIPYLNSQKSSLLHLGIGHSYRKPDSKEYGIHIPIGSSMTDYSISTEMISDANDIHLTNLEAVFVHGPWAIEAEYLNSQINTISNSYRFETYYAQVGWFIIGEHRNYIGSYQGFNRISPKRNFSTHSKGTGAWEIAARYQETDLTHRNILGGTLSEWTFGLNWYLNPATRFMMNYTWSNLENERKMTSFQARLQIDF